MDKPAEEPIAKTQNNLVRLFRDPQTTEFTQPNLGEVERPLSEFPGANIVLRYNGYWGAYSKDNSPPQGPALHQSWLWPATSSIRWLLPAELGF